MKSYVALAFAATALATPMPQAPTVPDCASSSDQTFQIQTVDKPASKRGLERRQLDGTLTITLKDGILKDQAGRQGYIASNDQFQFDPEPQPNSKQNDGFALCSNGSLALGGNRPYGDSTWWQCLSGDFYNLYSASQGMQCLQIHIQAVNMGSGSGASQAPTPTPTPTPVASSIPDGQSQANTPAPKPSAPAASQISDGQPQASAPAPAPKPSAPAVSQIPDGQPQASTPAPKPSPSAVSQISDGQPQASAPAPAPKPSAPAVSQIPDGQPQASAPAPAPAPTPVGPIVSQIPDGQPQATKPANGTVSKPSASAPAQFTGAAAASNVGMGAFAAGVFGLFALL